MSQYQEFGFIRKFQFECPHCKEFHEADGFLYSVAMYGIIFLFGKEDGYWGLQCPSCKMVSLKKSSLMEIEELLASFKEMEKLCVPEKPLLHYFSSPHSIESVTQIDRPYLCLANNNNDPMQQAYNEVKIDQFWSESNPYSGFNSYISYLKLIPCVGPTETIYLFKSGVIVNLIDIENNTRVKQFPRYIFPDDIQFYLSSFFYKVQIFSKIFPMIETDDEELVPFSPLIQNEHKTQFENNMDFVSILALRNDLYEKSNYPSSFLYWLRNIIQFIGIDNNIPIKELLRAQNENGEEIEPNSIIEWSTHQSEDPDMEEIFSLLWEKFQASTTQMILSEYSDQFCIEYSELIDKVDFNMTSTWDLKTKYFSSVCEAVFKPTKRRRTLKLTKNKEKQITKIENEHPAFRDIISNNPDIARLKIDLATIASAKGKNRDVLILGERGTGKELFARAFHAASQKKRKGPFVAVNCSSTSPELFESEYFGHLKGAFTGANKNRKGKIAAANGGTVFLDEIGTLPLKFQPRLLRLFQEREIQPVGAETPVKVDVQIIAATNRDLQEMAASDKFIPDLYDRINPYTLTIPPLRERKGDIPLLVDYFIKKNAADAEIDLNSRPITVSDEVIEAFMEYDWEGNVRELQNLIESVFTFHADRDDWCLISMADIPPDKLKKIKRVGSTSKKSSLKQLDDIEFLHIRSQLSRKQIAEKYGVTERRVSERWKETKQRLGITEWPRR